MATRNADLNVFMKSLATLWREGEVRRTHQKTPKAKRDWRTRVDPFDRAWPQVVGWLETEPTRTAKELPVRLQKEEPDSFADGQVRTLQRKMRIGGPPPRDDSCLPASTVLTRPWERAQRPKQFSGKVNRGRSAKRCASSWPRGGAGLQPRSFGEDGAMLACGVVKAVGLT